MNTTNKSSISEFYKDKVILISGGTGFIGKSLIEKLLRSCDGVKRILVLIRSKKGKSIEERIETFKKEKVFSVIQESNPSALDKIVGVEVDLAVGFWAMPKDEKIQSALKDVNIIFHCAASVRFDDPLRKAILINICATKSMLDFAQTLKHLDVYMHVSTTYSNCDRLKIEEKIYPAHVNWRTAIKLPEMFNEGILDALFYKYSNSMANTYVFTKHIAESMVNDYRDVVPLILYRPSIVMSSEKEPFPGFIDNFNGPVGLLLATAAGINRTSWQSHKAEMNSVPVDLCIKGMVVATTQLPQRGADLAIYNAASIKRTRYVDMIKWGKRYVIDKVPLNYCLWRPGGRITENYYEFYLRFIFTQVFLAMLADTAMRLLKKKPMFLKLQRVLINVQRSLQFFMNNVWDIRNDNFMNLNKLVAQNEMDSFGIKELYPTYVGYSKIALMGGRRYLLNWPDEDLPKARRNLRIAVLVDRIWKYFVFMGIFWYLYVSYIQ